MSVDKTKPHVVEDDNGKKTHYLGDVSMSMTLPQARKPHDEKNERPNDNV